MGVQISCHLTSSTWYLVFAGNFIWEDQKNQFFCLIQAQSVNTYGNMKFYILLWLPSLVYGLPQVDISTAMKSKQECRVIEKSSGKSKPCIGAFVFEAVPKPALAHGDHTE